MTERNKRVALILAVIFGGGAIVCLVCGVFGFFRAQQFVQEAQAGAEVTIPQADEFARSHDQVACRDESLRRSDLCGQADLTCLTQASVFIERCLASCAPTPGFCEGVPSPTEIMASAQWATTQCRELGRARDTHCSSLLQAVQRACLRH